MIVVVQKSFRNACSNHVPISKRPSTRYDFVMSCLSLFAVSVGASQLLMVDTT